MELREFKELLKKYRAGTASREEIDLVNRWYDAFGAYFPKLDRDREKDLRNTIHAGIQAHMHEKQRPSLWVRLRPYMRVAAILVGSLLVLAGVWHFSSISNEQPKERQPIVVEAEAGQIKQIVLPDSSVLWLNGGSKLAISARFNSGATRDVSLLYGEAHFDVKPDTTKPFIVNSPHLKIQVLGTSFTITSYRELPYERIAVSTGSVEVSGLDGQHRKILKRGERFEMDKASGMTSLERVEPASSNSWVEGTIYLEQVSFDELALVLKNKFRLEVVAGDAEIAAQKYTLAIDRTVSVNDLLEVICIMHHNESRKEGSKIIIY